MPPRRIKSLAKTSRPNHREHRAKKRRRINFGASYRYIMNMFKKKKEAIKKEDERN